ncbi:glycoside hydrolase family 105 protein [Neobacillus sp. NPDC058068]|uniref:glycoside hydrolase family 88/105 protein n=1 Tax=Neobacillus sp. NPDC058068 TaxID=3346325 RepID=UPI0036DD0FCF
MTNNHETVLSQLDAAIPISMAERASQTLMNRFTPANLPPANTWHYHQSVFLYGMQRVWEKNGKQEYFDYIKGYVDTFVDEDGNFLFARDELDSIQVGILLFPLYQATKDDRYKKAATKLRNLFTTLNKTKEGGFWHKDKYPYQMWLDGLFMAGPFALLFDQAFTEPELVDMVLYQESLMRKYMTNQETGLLYHAWDETRTMPWADPQTGCSPEFWGRSVGWYGTALIDILDILPENHEGRAVLIEALQKLISGYAKFQDEKTGLWYQIVDKVDRTDNWLESSCSSLFIYTIARAVEKGYVDKEYRTIAVKAYQGLLDEMIECDNETWKMKGICIGTSAGVYDYYVSRPVSENDLHGVGAFILASMAVATIIE